MNLRPTRLALVAALLAVAGLGSAGAAAEINGGKLPTAAQTSSWGAATPTGPVNGATVASAPEQSGGASAILGQLPNQGRLGFAYPETPGVGPVLTPNGLVNGAPLPTAVWPALNPGGLVNGAPVPTAPAGGPAPDAPNS